MASPINPAGEQKKPAVRKIRHTSFFAHQVGCLFQI